MCTFCPHNIQPFVNKEEFYDPPREKKKTKRSTEGTNYA